MERTTRTGTLRRGLRIGDQVHTEFELREATAGDYFAAEADTSSDRAITFRAALLARQLTRIGSFTGPFTLQMLGKLHPSDLDVMLAARDALEREGEAGQLGASSDSSPSC